MNRNRSARASTRALRRLFAVGLVVAVAAIIAALFSTQPDASSASPSSSQSDVPVQPPRHEGGRGGDDTGRVADGVTVFDDQEPAVANLDAALVEALRQAATEASGAGVELIVNSGWRSPEYQDELFQEAVAEYGSREEAARWVATSATSPHVSGEAVDIGHEDATAWLSEHGFEFGLCQIYDNEPWHYELRSEAMAQGCPAMYPDPSQDPRMQL